MAPALEFENGGAYTPLRHDRFAPGSFPYAPVPNTAFLLAEHADQLTGVGWQEDQPQRKVALISPRHVLNATHYPVSGTLVFLSGDGALKRFEVVDNRVASNDISIATLDRAVTPEDAITVLPIVVAPAQELIGREIFYLGRAPGGQAFAVGATSIHSAGAQHVLWSAGVAVSLDRVRGTQGDSGSPSLLLEGGRLAVTGHHYEVLSDFSIGYPAARDAVTDMLASDGQLPEAVGETRLGDPQAGGLVVDRLTQPAALAMEVHVLAFPVTRQISLHNFASTASSVTLRTGTAAFALVEPATGQLVHELRLPAPPDGARVAVEVAFTASGWGAQNDILRITDAATSYAIDLSGVATDLGVAPPALALTPAEQAGRAGEMLGEGDALDYEVEITNLDAAGSAPADFGLVATYPPGWFVALDWFSLQLAPGESRRFTARVYPAGAAQPGPYAFEVRTLSDSEPVHRASVAAVYTIVDSDPPQAPDTSPPSVPTDLQASLTRYSIDLRWSAASDDIGVAGYEVFRDGAQIATVSATSHRDDTTERGASYLYAVRAFDAAGNRSVLSAPIFFADGAEVGVPPAPACTPTANERGRRCRDGVDNDCDGEVDAADSECQ